MYVPAGSGYMICAIRVHPSAPLALRTSWTLPCFLPRVRHTDRQMAHTTLQRAARGRVAARPCLWVISASSFGPVRRRPGVVAIASKFFSFFFLRGHLRRRIRRLPSKSYASFSILFDGVRTGILGEMTQVERGTKGTDMTRILRVSGSTHPRDCLIN